MRLWDYLSVTPAVATQANKKTGVPEPPFSVINDKIALPDFEKAKSATESDSSNNVDYGKLIREKGYYGAFLAMNKKPDFDAEEKRLRRSRELTLLGDIANLGGQVLASGMGARRFAPIQSQVPHYTEKLQRLRDARRAYDVDFNNKSLSMIFQEYDQKRRNEAAQAAADLKYERDLKMKQADQAFEIGMLGAKGKQALEQQAVKVKDAKELAALNHRYKLGEASAQADSNKGKNKNEIAYVTKYGNVHFDNPKNKRAATYSTLEIMRNGATETERRKIDEILYKAQNGDIDSYNKAEMYVSQNLNSDPVALKHLYELAKQYGHVSTNDSQKQLQNKARGKVDGWSLSGTSPNSSINGDDGWSLK